MMWYPTETVMALHRARFDDERRLRASRRRQQSVSAAKPVPIRLRVALAR